jgi:predicted  nucleic acid-binding Zn-ribbon protein
VSEQNIKFKYLLKEEELKIDIKDTRKHIKDLEHELEFLLTREPHEVKYIASVKKHIDNLYQNLDELYRKWDNEIN